MALAFDLRDGVNAMDWTTARGFLVEQFDRLYAALQPINAAVQAHTTVLASITPVYRTWMPRLVGDTVEGVHTYSVQTATSVKIDRLVHIVFSLVLTAKDAAMAGTNARVRGLPYPAARTADVFHAGACSLYGNLGAHTGLVSVTGPSLSDFFLYDANQATVAVADITNTSYVRGALTYLTD